jgi:hypothetical protein
MPESCRYCLEEEGEFISPCRCKGSVGFVHEDCLNKWLVTISQEKESHCPICNYEIKTNYIFEKYIFGKKDPLNKESYYWYVLAHLLVGILIYRYEEALLHTLYMYLQIGTYIGHNMYSLYYLNTVIHKKEFIEKYFQPGLFIISFLHTYILCYLYMCSRNVEPLVTLWLFCIAHLLYPINIREMNNILETINLNISMKPRVWVR